MLQEMAALGFGCVELSHGIRITLVPGILRALEEGVVRVTSTHNFCPLPMGILHAAPNVFEPSRAHVQEHDQWLRHTRRSIDFAAQVGARVLVMHLGSVRFFWSNPSAKLRDYRRRHGSGDVRDDRKYTKLLGKAVAKLRARIDPYWAQVLASLEEIRDYALEKGVAIGCENRERFEELPVDEDFPGLFESLPTPHPCGYWHDTGHAHLKQAMGLLDHRAHLQRNAERLLGFHLHDVAGEDDHVPIGDGEIDFDMVSEFWRPHHLLTLELGPRVTPQQVVDSREAIEGLIDARFGGAAMR